MGDPSRVVFDTDVPLQENSEAQEGISGATIIYLRQLGQPLDLGMRMAPQARNTDEMPLTVITFDGYGGRHLYQFRLVLNSDTQYSVVEIISEYAQPLQPPLVAQQNAAQQSAIASPQSTIQSTIPEPTSESTQAPPSSSSPSLGQQIIQRLERGLSEAQNSGLIAANSPESVQLQNLLEQLKQGQVFETAVQSLNISIALLNQVFSLGETP